MKKINFNFKSVKETIKTIVLCIVIAGVAGFVAGVHYEQNNVKANAQIVKAMAPVATASTSK